MNKIFLITILCVFSVLLILAKSYTSEQETENIILDRSQEELCAEKGEIIGSCVGCITKCCDDLFPMFNLVFNDQCIDMPAPGAEGICSNCGNGICDNENNEDYCNCPEDCKKDMKQE